MKKAFLKGIALTSSLLIGQMVHAAGVAETVRVEMEARVNEITSRHGGVDAYIHDTQSREAVNSVRNLVLSTPGAADAAKAASYMTATHVIEILGGKKTISDQTDIDMKLLPEGYVGKPVELKIGEIVLNTQQRAKAVIKASAEHPEDISNKITGGNADRASAFENLLEKTVILQTARSSNPEVQEFVDLISLTVPHSVAATGDAKAIQQWKSLTDALVKHVLENPGKGLTMEFIKKAMGTSLKLSDAQIAEMIERIKKNCKA